MKGPTREEISWLSDYAILTDLGAGQLFGSSGTLDRAARLIEPARYARALWAPGIEVGLDAYSVAKVLSSFAAIRPYLLAAERLPRPPFKLIRVANDHGQPARRRQTVSFEQLVLPQLHRLEVEAQKRGVELELRGRSLVRRFMLGMYGPKHSRQREDTDIELPHWDSLARQLIKPAGTALMRMMPPGSKLSIGFYLHADEITCHLWGDVQRVTAKDIVRLLDASLQFEASSGTIKAETCRRGFLELLVSLPYPDVYEEPSAAGAKRLAATVAELERETGGIWHITEGACPEAGMLRATCQREGAPRQPLPDAQMEPADHQFITRLRAVVGNAFRNGTDFSITAAASAMRLGNARTLQRRLKTLGLAYRNDVVIPARLDLAADLLREGQSVKKVAARAGYADASRFAMNFRSRFGVLPSRYARQKSPA